MSKTEIKAYKVYQNGECISDECLEELFLTEEDALDYIKSVLADSDEHTTEDEFTIVEVPAVVLEQEAFHRDKSMISALKIIGETMDQEGMIYTFSFLESILEERVAEDEVDPLDYAMLLKEKAEKELI